MVRGWCGEWENRQPRSAAAFGSPLSTLPLFPPSTTHHPLLTPLYRPVTCNSGAKFTGAVFRLILPHRSHQGTNRNLLGSVYNPPIFERSCNRCLTYRTHGMGMRRHLRLGVWNGSHRGNWMFPTLVYGNPTIVRLRKWTACAADGTFPKGVCDAFFLFQRLSLSAGTLVHNELGAGI